MRVEIDQSGKVEQLDTHTVVAFSNGEKGAVYATAAVKRFIYQSLPEFLVFREDFDVIFFAVLVFLAIRNKKIDSLIIDEEYTGKDVIIREKLKELFKKENLKIPEIQFALIGKLSPAHRLAWAIHKKKAKLLAKVIVEKDIIGLLAAKEKSRARQPHSPLLRRGSAHHPTVHRLYHRKSR